MKALIIGRHGHYSHEPKDGMGLSASGKAEVEQLIEMLRQHAHGTVKVVYCDQVRIEQSAEMIAEAFGVTPITSRTLVSGTADQWCEVLQSGTADLLYEKKAAEIVTCVNDLGEDVDTLIVVNSLPLLRLLPQDFAKQVLGAEFPEIKFRRSEKMDAEETLPTGSAVVIDCAKKSLTLVRRDEPDEVVVDGISEPEAPASPPPKSKPQPQSRLPGIRW